MKILITAGPTHEAIDPVRYIGNYSSGKMGYALAQSFIELNFQVFLVSGPTQLDKPENLASFVEITSAHEMYEACIDLWPDMDAAILSAAVADFTPKEKSSKKLKKSDKIEMRIDLKKTKDILYELGKTKKRNQILTGFSLETHDAEKFAKGKLNKKNCDFIVMNQLSDDNQVFGSELNSISLFSSKGLELALEKDSKVTIASKIADFLNHRIKQKIK